MLKDGKKVARLRLLKRIGLIGLITTSVIGAVFLILSFITQGNAAFSIRIDNPGKSENSGFRMLTSDTPEGQEINYLSADPMQNGTLVDAMDVEDYLYSLDKYEGSQNMHDDVNSLDQAMVYTVYLSNISEEDLNIRYVVRLDGYRKSQSMEYFRILIQTELDTTITNTYYGNPRNKANPYTNLPNDLGENSNREVIGSTVIDEVDGNSVVTTPVGWDMSKGNDGYCVNFNDLSFKDIINASVSVPSGKIMRFTYVAFFEGGDPDSFVKLDEETYLLLSLHFGE